MLLKKVIENEEKIMSKTVKELCDMDISIIIAKGDISFFDKRLNDIIQAHEYEVSLAITNEQLKSDVYFEKIIDLKKKKLNL